MLQIPAHVLALVHDIAHAVGPASEGGRHVTLAELAQIAEDAAQLARALAELAQVGR